eukprot:CAMPEP_0172370892 /NCGR_PEP_ID=MMETSP1060-20121228/40256_1 /TAXON_ID=37318 /ORGANISM="Pseudo-nitzschia pungens, Strain cf. cingulata" /LENGTH=479 /DNA_ID=CAMNT_0013096345 /DNA_START=86 /DNA_END=1525 /DNA_ORIENTATION=+
MSIQNTEEAMEHSKSIVDRLFTRLTDKESLITDVYDGLINISTGKEYSNVDSLKDAFNKFKISKTKGNRPKRLVTLTTSAGVRKLSLRVPDVDDASKNIKENLAQYVHFACKVLSIDSSHVTLFMDKEVGSTCRLAQPVKLALQHMVAASDSITGLVGSKSAELKPFKGPAQCYLVAIRILNRNSSLCKPAKRKSACNLNKLKDMLDTLMGLNIQGVEDFAKNFIRQTFALATTLESALPSSFYVATKSENNVTSTEGILAALGYMPICPSVNKLSKIATARIQHDEEGVARKVVLPKDKTLLNRDNAHLAAFKLMLPMISEDQRIGLKEQTKHPEKYLSESSKKFYVENSEFVASGNKTYAILSSSLKTGKKKTTPKHVQNALGEATRKIANGLIFQDRGGNQYPTYMDVPVSLRHHLEKLTKRKLSRAKRDRGDESDSEDDIDMAISRAIVGSPSGDPKGSSSSSKVTMSKRSKLYE